MRARGKVHMADKPQVDTSANDGARRSREDLRLLKAWTKTRDKDALARLFERNKNAVYRTAQLYVSQAAAEDIVQSVFLQLAQDKAKFTDMGKSVRAWLVRVTINQCHLHVRTAVRRKKREDRVASIQTPFIIDRQLDSELGEQLRKAFTELPADYRQAILLRYMEGMSVKDAAFSMNLKPNTMEQRILRGIQKLRKSLASTGATASLAGLPKILSALQLSEAPSSLKLSPSTLEPNAIPSPGLPSHTNGVSSGAIQMYVLGAGILVLSFAAFFMNIPPTEDKNSITPLQQTQDKTPEKIEDQSTTRWNFSQPPPDNLYPILNRWAWRESQDGETGVMIVPPAATALVPIPRTADHPTFTIRVRLRRFSHNPIEIALKWIDQEKILKHKIWKTRNADIRNFNQMLNIDFHFHESFCFIKKDYKINCLMKIFEPLTARHQPGLIMKNVVVKEIILMDNQPPPSASDLNTIQTWSRSERNAIVPATRIPVKGRFSSLFKTTMRTWPISWEMADGPPRELKLLLGGWKWRPETTKTPAAMVPLKSMGRFACIFPIYFEPEPMLLTLQTSPTGSGAGAVNCGWTGYKASLPHQYWRKGRATLKNESYENRFLFYKNLVVHWDHGVVRNVKQYPIDYPSPLIHFHVNNHNVEFIRIRKPNARELQVAQKGIKDLAKQENLKMFSHQSFIMRDQPKASKSQPESK